MEENKIKPTYIIDGIEYYNMSNGAKYLGVSYATLAKKLKQSSIERLGFDGGGKERLVSRDILDRLKKPMVLVEESKLSRSIS